METQEAHGLTLREIVEERLTLDEFIAEHEGELTPLILKLMQDVDDLTEKKIEAIAWFVREEKARVVGIDAMIGELQRRKQAIVNRVTWLKDSYLLEQMHRLGLGVGDSIKGTLSTVRLQWNNPRLDGEISEERLVDMKLDPRLAGFVRYTPEQYELNKKEMLDSLKAWQYTLRDYAAAQATLASLTATTKEKVKAALLVQQTDAETLARAQAFVDEFKELTIVRDESVRIA